MSRSFEESLDRAWDRLAANAPPQPDEPALLAVARHVAAYDNTPGPSPAAAARMRRRLRAAIEETKMSAISSEETFPPAAVARSARPTRLRPDGQPQPRFERLAAALLVAALMAAALAWGHLPGQGNPSRPGPAQLAAPNLASPLPAASAQPPVASVDGDPANTSQLPGPGPLGLAKVVWKADGRAATLTTADGRLFSLQFETGTSKIDLVALDLTTGARLWAQPINPDPTDIISSVVASNGLVYAETRSGLAAFDQKSGALAWTYSANVAVNSQAPAVANGLVFATFRDETLRAIDAATGKEAWKAALPASTVNPPLVPGILSITASPAVANGVVYAAGNGGLVLAADAKTGAHRWTYQAAADGVATPRVADGLVLLTSGFIVTTESPNTSWLEAVDAQTGALVWRQTEQPEASVMAVANHTLYLAGGQNANVISALYLGAGQGLQWTYTASDRVDDGFVVGDLLYFFTEDGAFAAVDAGTGVLVWSAKLGEGGAYTIAGGLIVLAGQSAISAIGGTMTAATPGPRTSPTTADLSGLPPCQPPRAVPSAFPSGTPTASLDIETHVLQPVTPGTIAQVLAANLPTGPAADAATVAGIAQTLTEIADCMPPAGESDAIAGFFTDDFYRRGDGAGGSSTYFHGWPSRNNTALTLSVGTTVTLPDGRIAAQIDYNHTPKRLLIFVQQNGRWLIDEQYLIVTAYSDGVG